MIDVKCSRVPNLGDSQSDAPDRYSDGKVGSLTSYICSICCAEQQIIPTFPTD